MQVVSFALLELKARLLPRIVYFSNPDGAITECHQLLRRMSSDCSDVAWLASLITQPELITVHLYHNMKISGEIHEAIGAAVLTGYPYYMLKWLFSCIA